MMLDYIRDNLKLLSEQVKAMKVADMHFGCKESLIILDTDRPLRAFNKMIANNVSGLGVTNLEGKLVDVISARDIKGLQMESGRI